MVRGFVLDVAMQVKCIRIQYPPFHRPHIYNVNIYYHILWMVNLRFYWNRKWHLILRFVFSIKMVAANLDTNMRYFQFNFSIKCTTSCLTYMKTMKFWQLLTGSWFRMKEHVKQVTSIRTQRFKQINRSEWLGRTHSKDIGARVLNQLFMAHSGFSETKLRDYFSNPTTSVVVVVVSVCDSSLNINFMCAQCAVYP